MNDETNNTQFPEETALTEEIAGNVYNADETDVDLEEFAEAVRSGQKKSLRGLILTVTLLLAGILAVLIFWLIRYKDLFL